MDLNKLVEAADPKKLAGFIRDLPEPHHHDHRNDGTIETKREAQHKGHYVVIRTTYQIEVDGRVFQVPLALGNDGQLHCHSLPNYQFDSAVDLVERLIDTFPEDFPLVPAAQRQPGRHTGHEPVGHGSHGPGEEGDH